MEVFELFIPFSRSKHTVLAHLRNPQTPITVDPGPPFWPGPTPEVIGSSTFQHIGNWKECELTTKMRHRSLRLNCDVKSPHKAIHFYLHSIEFSLSLSLEVRNLILLPPMLLRRSLSLLPLPLPFPICSVPLHPERMCSIGSQGSVCSAARILSRNVY